MRAYEFINEGDVIGGEFEKRLRQKKGLMYNPDAEPPVSRIDGEKFERFEVEEHGKSSATIYGVRIDGGKEAVGTTQREVAHTLAGAYNAGGYSKQTINKIPLDQVFKNED